MPTSMRRQGTWGVALRRHIHCRRHRRLSLGIPVRRGADMSKVRDCIDEQLAAWIRKQHVFFVATAPLSQHGHINCSPKGGDSLRVLGPMEIVYQDYTGSGAETAAHLRENGRILVMFCAFEGKPNIV